MKRVLLIAATTGYQVREFSKAAARLGLELVLATDRCHILDDPWGDGAVALRFEEPAGGLDALVARGPFDGILAVGDRPACVAAQVAPLLGARFSPESAVTAASDKFLTRECFREAGLNVPEYRLLPLHDGRGPQAVTFPCVLKPLHLSASRGVIRADNPQELEAAYQRIGKMLEGERSLLVEEFIPGREFALEGVVSGGRLQVLAIFDKPDPLDGPYFEESIYVTPSREFEAAQQAIREETQRAVSGLGLTDGPVHAEMRVNARGVWMLEAAARPIGGLCARVLRFEMTRPMALEELLLLHAVGEDVAPARLEPGAHGVMMIPIPRAGVYRGVSGAEDALRVPGIEDVIVTAKEGQTLVPLPEAASYLGFVFARAASAAAVEDGLRRACECLRFEVSTALPVVE